MEPRHLAFTVQFTGVAFQPITEVDIVNEWVSIAKIKALWDTGATTSCIANNFAKKIWLPIVWEWFNKGITNITEKCDIYLANIWLPNRVSIPIQLMWIADREDFAILIGMDVISQGEFALSTHGGVTKMSFCLPCRQHIDFVKEIDAGPKVLLWRRSPCHCWSWKRYKDCCEKKDQGK